MVQIRPAVAADQATINRIIRKAGINPMSLDWRRFVIAEESGAIIGIGQVKHHGDGSRELASIAVLPERQGEGIASEIIRTLLGKESGAIYLTCRDSLEGFYTRFGFKSVAPEEMSPYFRRIYRLASLFMPLMRIGARLLVMKRMD